MASCSCFGSYICINCSSRNQRRARLESELRQLDREENPIVLLQPVYVPVETVRVEKVYTNGTDPADIALAATVGYVGGKLAYKGLKGLAKVLTGSSSKKHR